MPADSSPTNTDSALGSGSASVGGLKPLTPAVRNRLQQLFLKGKDCAEKNDHDYANDLFAQCVIGDPSSIIYLQHFLANLQKKYGNNKKGAKMAGLKSSSAKKKMKQAKTAGDWSGVIKAGCQLLFLKPWDAPALITMSEACDAMQIDECQLYYLRWALNAEPKNVDVNRHAAQTLSRMGQFDQAIICWHRVEEADTRNEEAAREISRLTVEKTIQQGGYDRESIPGAGPAGAYGRTKEGSEEETEEEDQAPQKTPEERLRDSIEADPAEVSNYLELADIMSHQSNFDEAEVVLTKAMQVSGGSDPKILDRQEENAIRKGQVQVEIAERRANEDQEEDSLNLARKLKAQQNQLELQVYLARTGRDPNSPGLQYELGIRLKKAGKMPDAIQAFQAAREDTRRKSRVHLELGECFQKIEQYNLAMKEYQTAIELCSDRDLETKKLSLYRSGVLGTGLRDLDKAEKHFTELAAIDFGYKDVAARLDKINRLRDSG